MGQDLIGRKARKDLCLTRDRCTATNRAGERCGRPPIRGGFVCVVHGGRAPQVQRSARERLLALVDPAMDALLRALKTGPQCDACGRSDADRDPVVIKAAQLVLDRTGFHPRLTVQAARPSETPEWARYLTHEELAVVSEFIALAEERLASGADPEDGPPKTDIGDVEDGVFVEDQG